MKEKPQTSAQRLANPVWLRAQVKALIQLCEQNIAEDLKIANQTSGDVSVGYFASVQIHRYWKHQFESVLCGKAPGAGLEEDLKQLKAAR